MQPFQVHLCALALSMFAVLFGSVTAEASFTPILPPSYPLAVRNPYLSGSICQHISRRPPLTISLAWLPGNQVAELPTAVAQFYHGQQLTWSVMARVDGNTYSLFGVPRPSNNIKPGTLISADFSATHTTFTVIADNVKFVLDFFSPVSPHNYTRQSMPFSYLTVSTSSLNYDVTPSVQIYSDMDNSWIGQFGDGDGINLTWNWNATQKRLKPRRKPSA